jgi:hypothetical protein
MPLVLALHLRAGAPLFGEGAAGPCRHDDIFRAGRSMQVGVRNPGIPVRLAHRIARMTARHQRWTQTNIDDLRSGVAGGVNIEAIADALGRTVEDTRTMAQRLRLRVKPSGTLFST